MTTVQPLPVCVRCPDRPSCEFLPSFLRSSPSPSPPWHRSRSLVHILPSFPRSSPSKTTGDNKQTYTGSTDDTQRTISGRHYPSPVVVVVVSLSLLPGDNAAEPHTPRKAMASLARPPAARSEPRLFTFFFAIRAAIRRWLSPRPPARAWHGRSGRGKPCPRRTHP